MTTHRARKHAQVRRGFREVEAPQSIEYRKLMDGNRHVMVAVDLDRNNLVVGVMVNDADNKGWHDLSDNMADFIRYAEQVGACAS